MHIRIAVEEVVMVVLPVRLREIIAELAVPDRLRLKAEIHARLIKRHWIEAGEHTDIRQNRGIIFSMAVAVR